MSSEYGCILHLFTKQKQDDAMLELTKLNLKVGHGIKGDINANPISPRQVLLVRYEDILEFSIKPGELRENLVITGIQSEKFVPGSLITFESGAAIRLTFYCEPCKRIAHLVESLKSIQYKRGILGVVIASGKIQTGSKFKIQINQFPMLSENPYRRFLDFIIKVPNGKIVTYKEIVKGIGVNNSYMRAIPMYIKKTSVANYPIHRILDSKGNLLTYISGQKNKLEFEGIKVLCKIDVSHTQNKYYVDMKEYLWKDTTLYLNS
ncbi:MGMT family protein [Chlorogloeopsis sp. ULAP01]|uniref:MGMT family protein n=1 Tax=Chlorogloeopsis sp. ULAP01 TaxID=3056483 RepID=UPI0025AA3895|nr:MGMT family protein [Chlorogloeopsis sp. ULAP01]MDM9379938.1 MGMT family protein [Chlorogloeopsis sp. ULAP01]